MVKSSQGRSVDWTRRIVELAPMAVDVSGERDIVSANQKLARLVERVVGKGSDRPIHRAIDQLDSQHNHDAADLVEFWADEAATSVEMSFSRGTLNLSGVATAFLIPVVIAMDSHDSLPRTVPLGDTLNKLAKTLRHYGFLSDTPSVVLLPGLYRLHDLPTSWAERRRWVETTALALTGSIPELAEPSSEEASQVATSLHLRFLVAVIVESDDDGDPGPMLSGEWPDPDMFDQWGDTIDAWREECSSVLQTFLKATAIAVDIPNLWMDAIESGVDLFNLLALDTSTQGFIQLSDIEDPAQLVARIVWNESEDTRSWDITLEGPANLTTSWEWACFSDRYDALGMIMDGLRSYGIARMNIDERS